jgi:cysteinyl-tRNA synthetase
MTIRLHDTLSGETRPFAPLDGERARIYSCGPTVYGPAHIGNFRSFLFADLLVRHLRWRGVPVTWVMNVTDIDDKIIKGAAAAGVRIDELTERYLAGFLEDADALRMTRPDVLPRATEHIPEIVDLIGTLLDRGHAYRTDDGSTPSSSGSASASRRTSTPRTTSVTSHCGKRRNRASRRGTPPSGRAGPAGTSNARQ